MYRVLFLICIAYAVTIPTGFKLELITLQNQALKTDIQMIEEAVAGMPNVTEILFQDIIQSAKTAASRSEDCFLLVWPTEAVQFTASNPIGEWAQSITSKYRSNQRVLDQMDNVYARALHTSINQWNKESDLELRMWPRLRHIKIGGTWGHQSEACFPKN